MEHIKPLLDDLILYNSKLENVFDKQISEDTCIYVIPQSQQHKIGSVLNRLDQRFPELKYSMELNSLEDAFLSLEEGETDIDYGESNIVSEDVVERYKHTILRPCLIC